MSTDIDIARPVISTQNIIDRIFKDPGIKYELTEFENLGQPLSEILSIYPKTAATGREAGKTKYYLNSFIPFSSGNDAVQVYVEDGIEHLKSYMNAKDAPVAVWSNGSDSIILFRPYPKDFEALFDLPKRDETPKDVLTYKLKLADLKKEFNFKDIIQGLEELVLADSGKDEFNEIFKLIFAKIWDEKQALEERRDQSVEFGLVVNLKNGDPDPDLTFERNNRLFQKACQEWPGIFKPGEELELMKRHLVICIGKIQGVRLMGSNLRIIDDAFEYLLPTEAKKKKGQFFTPRHVVEMCNPTRKEYAMNPSCGSGGFLLHAMDWCYPADDNEQRELRKHRYAAEIVQRLDYPIFMAVSERGGKNNSGDYEYMLDADGHLVEDGDGQPRIDQDLVNYELGPDDLTDAATISDEQLCVAEAFVRFAQTEGFDFWGAE